MDHNENSNDNLAAKDLGAENLGAENLGVEDLDTETDESIGEDEIELYENELNELRELDELESSGDASSDFEEGARGEGSASQSPF